MKLLFTHYVLDLARDNHESNNIDFTLKLHNTLHYFEYQSKIQCIHPLPALNDHGLDWTMSL